jgi:DNA repair exonuclease SbcCD nuclease subunit
MQGNGAVPRRATYRFVHASDLLLDAPVRGIPAPSVQLRDALRDAAVRAWQSLVELALERDAAFVILAGGLFGETVPGLRSCVALRDGLERLRSRAIEVFVALNRDDAAAAARLPWLANSARCSPPTT